MDWWTTCPWQACLHSPHPTLPCIAFNTTLQIPVNVVPVPMPFIPAYLSLLLCWEEEGGTLGEGKSVAAWAVGQGQADMATWVGRRGGRGRTGHQWWARHFHLLTPLLSIPLWKRKEKAERLKACSSQHCSPNPKTPNLMFLTQTPLPALLWHF